MRPIPRTRRPQPMHCPNCGQPADSRPGLKLDEFDKLEAVWVGDQSVPTPQRLTCCACQYAWPVARGTIDVRIP